MTTRGDAEKIIAKYRLVPKAKRDFVAETLELAIKHYDRRYTFQLKDYRTMKHR